MTMQKGEDWPYDNRDEAPRPEDKDPLAPLRGRLGSDLLKHTPVREQKSASRTQIKGDHYKKYPIQPYEYNQRNRLPYCEGNVVKYVTRHRDKGGRDDILKAIHYLQLLLEEEYP